MTFSIIQRVKPGTEKMVAIAAVHRELLQAIEARVSNIEAVRSIMQRSMEDAWLDDKELPKFVSTAAE